MHKKPVKLYSFGFGLGSFLACFPHYSIVYSFSAALSTSLNIIKTLFHIKLYKVFRTKSTIVCNEVVVLVRFQFTQSLFASGEGTDSIWLFFAGTKVRVSGCPMSNLISNVSALRPKGQNIVSACLLLQKHFWYSKPSFCDIYFLFICRTLAVFEELIE